MIAVGSNLPPNVALGIDLPHRRQGADFALQQGDDVVLPPSGKMALLLAAQPVLSGATSVDQENGSENTNCAWSA